jgi:hypothetical protein
MACGLLKLTADSRAEWALPRKYTFIFQNKKADSRPEYPDLAPQIFIT